MKKTAIVITPMCPRSHEVYGIRIEKRENTWVRTWAFPIKAMVAEREGFQSKMDLSNMKADATFQGCPHCESKTLVQCGDCKKIYCYEGETESTCPWCGNTGIISDGGWDSVAGGGY